jgi:hypothetical protein
MSTNIDDLPGPSPDESEYEEHQQEHQYEEYDDDMQDDNQTQYNQTQYNQAQYNQANPRLHKETLYEQPSKIKMDIKKVQKRKDTLEDDSMFDILKREVSEENLLLLIVLYLASTSLVDEYAKKALNMISFNTSSFAINIIKCVILLLVFILAKNYLLPYIKL